MTERVIRRNARPAPVAEPVPPLRRANRTILREEPAQRSTHTSTHQGRSTLSESAQDEILEPSTFDTSEELAYVEIGHGKTINTQNFSGVRIDVRVKLPCRVADVQATLAEASEIVAARLVQEEEYMLGALAPRRSANRRG